MNETGTDEGRPDSNAGMPRWVKISSIAVAVVIVLLVAAMVLGGGEHGPGRHFGGLPIGIPAPSGMTGA